MRPLCIKAIAHGICMCDADEYCFKAMAKSGIPDLPDSANQPTSHNFPKKSFGKKTVVERSFQATWFNTWKWLHYDETNDKA